MERREMLGLVGAGAAGLWTAGAAGAVQDPKDKEKHEHEHQHGGGDGYGPDHAHMRIVGECAGVCSATMRHCIGKLKEAEGKDREAHAKAAIFTNDCESFCVQHLSLMAGHSPLSRYATHACAEACRDCAKVCDDGDDEMMKKCAQVCRDCEKACREHLKQCLKKE